MKKIAWRTLFLVVVLTVMVLVAATGCGTQDATSEPSADEKSAEAPAAETESGDVINLGFASAFTGAYGADGIPWYNAMMLAVEEMNAAGGPLGRQIKVFNEDDQSSVEEGIKAARKLITVNNVIAIVGPSSDILLGDLPLAEEYKVPLLSPCAGTTRMDTLEGDYHYRTCPSDSWDAKVVAKFLIDEGVSKLAIFSQIDESRKILSEVTRDAFVQLGGTIVAEEYFNPNQPTYQAELKKIFDQKPDVVFLACGQETGGIILEEWYKQDYGGKWMLSSDMAVPEMFDFVDHKVMEGIWTEGPSAPTDTEWFKDFAERYQKRWNVAETPGSFVGQTYDATILVGLAIEAAGEAKGEAIAQKLKEISRPPGVEVRTFEEGIKALREGKDINYEGVGGPVDFDQYGSVAGSSAVWIGKDGRWEQCKFYGPDSIDF